MMNYEEYFNDYMQQIYAASEAQSDFSEVIFTEKMCDYLVEQAVLENYNVVSYKKRFRGIRADAYHYSDEGDVLTLIITDFNSEPRTLIRTNINDTFKRAVRFFEESCEESFYRSLDEADPGYGLAREIHLSVHKLRKLRFILLSNGLLSRSVQEIPSGENNGIPYSYDIWDLGRVQRIEESGKSKEDIIVDFTSLSNGGLPCLPAYTGDKSYKSYLLAMPGALVADLYDQYGERLLEQNVRTFLQFKGKVNQGIRNTIQNEPAMFFAYNNGITATAEEVAAEVYGGIVLITAIRNFQIVNGGQTTASLFNTKKNNKVDLAEVHVQVKLTIIPPEETEIIVPKISEYANTQNKVSAADFFSNHPFHLRIEGISRRLWAPSSEGRLKETRWYYERVRGQYANARVNLTPAKQREFDVIYPRTQLFVKTDLAKYENTWDMKPQVVSLGAQKNFAKFAESIAGEWSKSENDFNELYFKRLIAKAIIFKSLDRLILKQPWYGGYKANIVTYTIAKFAFMIKQEGMFVDLEQIWNQQSISAEMEKQLLSIAESVNVLIQDTPAGITNVTEWCKKELCWQNVQKLPLKISSNIWRELISRSERKQKDSNAKDVQKIDNGINAQKYVIEKGSEYWHKMLKWSASRKIFTPKEHGIMEVASQFPFKIPTEVQAKILLSVEQKAFEQGFII